ncbi:MAG: hypothetical protein ASARMPRED_003924 [Alectoria sarmentosa]|nr:MAG: hypothetical protein ASARMPRED_003924 [Alectoria sarmentosa]
MSSPSSSSSAPSIPSAEEVKTEVVEASKQTLSSFRSLIAGGVGGICAVVVGHPFDLVKVRMQTAEKGVYSGALDVVRKTVAREGLRKGLYAGVSAPLVGVTPMFAVSFWGYDVGQKLVRAFSPQTNSEAHFTITQTSAAGFFSAIPMTIITAPFERVKVLLQIQGQKQLAPGEKPRYSGGMDVVRQLYKEGGIRSVYRGSAMTLARDGPGSATYFASYEYVKRKMTPKDADGNPSGELSLTAVMTAGGAAGVAMWIPVFPIDTIKSRLQSAEGRPTIGGTIRGLYASGGFKAFFPGMGPAMARAVPANAVTFLGVELAHKAMNNARHLSTTPASRGEIRDAYILSAARTPTGKFNGSFVPVPAPQLGATAIKSALKKSGVPASKITDVYMGNVLQASVGQSPARQASILAGLSPSVDAVTINKVCASGLKAVVFAAQNIQLGLAEAQVAGGMENMSRVPYYVPRSNQHPSFGTISMEDGLIKDGLWDVYNQFHMGVCAEETAKKHNISRKEQDEYAIQSFHRAQKAWKEGRFTDEIAPVTIKGKKGEIVVERDEGYDNLREEKVPTLKPAFMKDGGTVTAANSSTFNDGASALVLGSRDIAAEYGSSSRVLARIVSSADAAVDPVDFPVAPAKAVPIALERAGISKEQVAVWEFNEAFAAVIKANQKILGLEGAKVNMLGGAISLGHALGSSGSRILTTLLHQLEVGDYGVAAICNGGGAATAMVVQRIETV